MQATQNEEYDVVVVGSGAGAFTGALAAAGTGDTLLIEKTDYLGGTTAYSGAGIWVPNNPIAQRAGLPDTPERARRYWDGTVGERGSARLRDAYLAHGPEAIAFLAALDPVEFAYPGNYPDYYPEVAGGFVEGRMFMPALLDAATLGDDLALLRPGLAAPGGQALPGPVPDPPLWGGRALLGMLLLAARRAGVRIRTRTALRELIVQDGRVTGVLVDTDDGARRIDARRGVLLAAGGFERNQQMRARYQDPAVARADWTLGSPGNTGDAIRAAVDVGAAVDLMEDCWWAPGFIRPDGDTAFVLFERTVPGAIIVDGTGRRFLNEALPYNDYGHQVLRAHTEGNPCIPAWFVADQHWFDQHSFCGQPAGTPFSDEWYAAGVRRADTVAELADAIGVPAAALVTTVERANEFARTGKDLDFQRGESGYDRHLLEFFHAYGDFPREESLPNPCLAPIQAPPFYAAPIVPSDLGTKGGLVCDGSARVLNADGEPIPGLHAAGNTMASVMGHAYPGPGSTLGPGIVFGYLAGRALGESADPAALSRSGRAPDR